MLGRLKQVIGFNPLLWARSVGRMTKLVRDHAAASPPGAGPPECLVAIIPWLGTAVPWFTLGVGLLLSAAGARVTFVIDDSRFGPNPARFRFILGAIRKVMAAVAKRHPVIHLSSVAPVSGEEMPADRIARLARLNGRWELRGEMLETGRAALEAGYRAQIAAGDRRIAAFLAAHRFDVMFVPGGVFGTSGAWHYHALRHGIRFASFDTGGFETVMLAANGLACQLQDIPRAFTILSERLDARPEEKARVLAEAQAEIVKRKGGTDTFESQMKGADSAPPELEGGILLALNSSWDAAALGPHRIFGGNSEWIVETVRYLLERTEARVIVRQHPAERLAFARTTDDYRGLLEAHFGDHPRLHFIAAEDPVNSYALLERCAAVIIHSSTIGIEAAAFGRPVITASSAYYAGLGFVNQAVTADDYHRLLSAAAAGELAVTEAMREDAQICFYITQILNWVFTPFNPGDYARWSLRPLAHWAAQPAVRRMIRSLIDDVPVAVLNHLDRVGADAA